MFAPEILSHGRSTMASMSMQAAESTSDGPGPQDFEEYRKQLAGFCYRMLGSWSEADDAVQETMVRAWRAADGFEGRSSVRSWLFRIASNVCTDMHRSPQRRARPMELGPSTRVADVITMDAPKPAEMWIHPVRDEDVISLDGDPADVATARESIRLAFVAALQHLPAKQRSALILCEVLQWQASEVAELLDTSVASVNSALQRARSTLRSLDGTLQGSTLDVATGSEHQELMDRYVAAFESYDIETLVTLLRDDVVLSMPPFDLWLQSPSEVADWLLGHGSVCKDSRLVPVDVNGTAGFGSYHLVEPGVWEPWAIQVIEVADNKIIGHHNFLYPDLFERMGLPPLLTA